MRAPLLAYTCGAPAACLPVYPPPPACAHGAPNLCLTVDPEPWADLRGWARRASHSCDGERHALAQRRGGGLLHATHHRAGAGAARAAQHVQSANQLKRSHVLPAFKLASTCAATFGGDALLVGYPSSSSQPQGGFCCCKCNCKVLFVCESREAWTAHNHAPPRSDTPPLLTGLCPPPHGLRRAADRPASGTARARLAAPAHRRQPGLHSGGCTPAGWVAGTGKRGTLYAVC